MSDGRTDGMLYLPIELWLASALRAEKEKEEILAAATFYLEMCSMHVLYTLVLRYTTLHDRIHAISAVLRCTKKKMKNAPTFVGIWCARASIFSFLAGEQPASIEQTDVPGRRIGGAPERSMPNESSHPLLCTMYKEEGT